MSDEPVNDTKAAKKNKKRKTKKVEPGCASTETKKELTSHEMLDILKSQLAEAKAAKDHKACSDLRDKVWVLSDIVAGVKTRIEEKELDRILTSIHEQFHPQDFNPSPVTEPTTSKSVSGLSNNIATVALEDKKLKSLRKKLEQIETLKSKLAKGEKLEINQLEKIKTEESIRSEILEMEEFLQSLVISQR